jgi:hypothetical protein
MKAIALHACSLLISLIPPPSPLQSDAPPPLSIAFMMQDWLKAVEFLRGALGRAKWPGHIPSADVLLDLVGRITTNNFGIYTGREGSSSSTGDDVNLTRLDAGPCDGTHVPEAQARETCGVARENYNGEVGDCPAQRQGIGGETLAEDKGAGEKTSGEMPEALGRGSNHGAGAAKGAQDTTEGWSGGSSTAKDALETLNSGMDRVCLAGERAKGDDDDVASHGVTKEGDVLGHDVATEPNSGNPCVVNPCKSADVVSQGFLLSGNPTISGGPSDCSNTGGDVKEGDEEEAAVMIGMAKPAETPGGPAPAEGASRKGERVREDVIGRELFIGVSFFNHSCNPNCVVERSQGGVARVIATRLIPVRHPCRLLSP